MALDFVCLAHKTSSHTHNLQLARARVSLHNWLHILVDERALVVVTGGFKYAAQPLAAPQHRTILDQSSNGYRYARTNHRVACLA